MIRKMWLRFALLLMLPGMSFADQIALKNGDHFSGTIEKSDGKSVTIKTEYAGEISVPWSAIETFTSTQPLHVTTSAGQTAVGPVTTSNDSLVVATPAQGPVTVPINTVSLVRNDSEQAAYEKSLHPSLSQGWTGGANVGFALTAGNSETKNLAIAFNAARATSNDKLSLYTTSVYATNDAPGASPSTIANAIQGGIRLDRNLNPRLFGFVGADFQTDDLQSLDLRSVLGGGLGFHAIKRETTTLDLLAGLNYTRENYSTFSRSLAAATLGEELMHKVRSSTVLFQKLYFYPDLSDMGQYRATFNLGTVTKISKWLGWQNSFGDIYVTNPPPGKKTNDVVFTTGLNFSFTH